MELTPYVHDLQNRLAVAAETGGDDARRLAQSLAAPLDAAVRLVLLDALSVAAGEISAELSPGSVDVRLRGGDPEFVVDVPAPDRAAQAPTPPTPPGPPAPPDGDDGSTTRTTLRLPDHLKTQVEAAAARDGVSVNTWLVRAVGAALGRPAPPPAGPTPPWGGQHLTGWVR